MPDSSYIGSELEIFKYAVNWKKYYGGLMRPFLGAEVLEVGAGIGATTEVLISDKQKSWVCLEPDSSLVEEIVKKISDGKLPPICDARVGDISCLKPDEVFDSVIYVDVLEHVENDREEITRSARHVRPGGHMIILAPAHQYLYTAFDKAIGHYRRYSRTSLDDVMSETGMQLVKSMYLDSVGTLASLANKLLLRSSMPSKQQILFWDKFLIPGSWVFDRVFIYRVGKSILSIWKRQPDATING